MVAFMPAIPSLSILSAPRRPPWPCIYDFAVRWRSRPDKGRRRGLLRLALAGPLRCAPGPALRLPPQRPGGNGGAGRQTVC